LSNHAARTRVEPKNGWGKIIPFVGVLAVLTLVAGPWIYHWWSLPDDSWPAYEGQVLETRVVMVGPTDSQYGNSVLYRVEVRAAWMENGMRQDAWVPTRKTGGDKTYLALWASQQGNECSVRVAPRNPGERMAFFRK
jgi:hypothetical protein